MSKENTNTSSFNQIEELGDIFNIPVASDSQQVWFVRTSGGDYYDDFRFNNFVAIGWDKIPAEWIIRRPLLVANSDCNGNEVHQLLSEKDFKNRVIELLKLPTPKRCVEP